MVGVQYLRCECTVLSHLTENSLGSCFCGYSFGNIKRSEHETLNQAEYFEMSLNYSDVIATTRLVSEFNDDNILQFTQLLFEQLNIENKSNFICKVLNNSYETKSLSQESINLLKQNAIQLAEKQMMKINNENNDSNNGESVSLYKYVTQSYPKSMNNNISLLPDCIFDNIGSYLNENDNISFGYLNKQLYIQSHTKSYLLAKTHDYDQDNYLTIDRFTLTGLLLPKSNPFHYSLPFQLELSNNFPNDENLIQMLKSKWFESLFTRLECFICANPHYLPYVPISTLFKSNNDTTIKYAAFELDFCDYILLTQYQCDLN